MAKLNLSLTRTESREAKQTTHAQYLKLLDVLHRGGKWGHEWTLPEGSSFGSTYWWSIENGEHPAYTDIAQTHVYFGVHPVESVPTTNRDGEPVESHRVRSRLNLISSISCVFADIDEKDFADQQSFRSHLKSIQPKPSVVVHTGRGVHMYWLLNEPFRVYGDETALARAKHLQRGWVAYTKSDPGAADLPRILRVPGTVNWKTDSGARTRFLRFDLNTRYTINELEGYLPTGFQETSLISRKTPRPVDPAELPKIKIALEILKPWRADDREEWVKIGMALSQLGDDGFELWDEWSKQSSKYDLDDAAAKWKSWKSAEDMTDRAGVTIGTLYHDAREDATNFDERDEKYLDGWLDKATDQRLTKLERGANRKELLRRLTWYPDWVVAEYRTEAKSKKWPMGDFDGMFKDEVTNGHAKLEQEDIDQIEGRRVDDVWLKWYPDTLRVNGEWWRYINGVWSVREAELIRREMIEICDELGVPSSKTVYLTALDIAASFLPHRDPNDWNPDPQLLVVENGALDLSQENPQLLEWSPEHYVNVKLPVRYDPEAKAPMFSKALRENLQTMDGKRRPLAERLICEFGGMCLVEQRKPPCSPWITGPPGGGKSTLIAAFEAVFGESSRTVDIEQLTKDKHGTVAILHKKLVTATEIDTDYIPSPGILQRIITGESVPVNPKFLTPYDYTARCGIIFAMNVLPGVLSSSGLFRRVKVITVNGRDPEYHDPAVIDTIRHDPDERSGILNLFLAGLKHVRKTGRMSVDPTVEADTAEWKTENDRVKMHLEARTVKKIGAKIQSALLYADFLDWVKLNRYGHMSLTTWVNHMKRLHQQKVEIGGLMYYTGIEFIQASGRVNLTAQKSKGGTISTQASASEEKNG